MIGARGDGGSEESSNGNGFANEDGGQVDNYSAITAVEEPQLDEETGEQPEFQGMLGEITQPPEESFTDYDEEDYESGKEAAEARVESGFMSRLFRPKTTRPGGTRSRGGRPGQRG